VRRSLIAIPVCRSFIPHSALFRRALLKVHTPNTDETFNFTAKLTDVETSRRGAHFRAHSGEFKRRRCGVILKRKQCWRAEPTDAFAVDLAKSLPSKEDQT
jgi:hypothetical protein